MKKRILFLWVLLLSTIVCTFAYDFKSGDLYYRETGDYTVEVTCFLTSFPKDYPYKFTSVVIPETVNGYSVTGIGYNAFAYCDSLRSVTIPNSVTTIGENAFHNCTNLTSVNIPNSVTSIGEDAFYKCTSLTSITIPNSVTEVGCDAFGYCTGLTSVSWNANVDDIDCYEGIFTYAGDRDNGCEFTFGDEVNSIPSHICAHTYLNRVTIGNNVTSIGTKAFFGCRKLKSITIPNSVTSIGVYAFYECYLKSITISENITTIEDGVFERNSMTSIIIPESVTSIGDDAFKACWKLKSITIPENVTTIGVDAFYDCDDLQEITFKPMTPPTGCGGAFESCRSWCYPDIEKVYVPCGTKRDYTQTFASWSYNWFVEIGTPTISVATEDPLKGTARVEQQASSCNDNAIISATPAEHYRFAQWNDGNTDNPRTIVATRDTTYTAEFIPICNITVVYDMKQGYVSGDGTYDLGAQVRLVAESNRGYEFSQWSDGTTYNPYIFAATEDITLEALFIPTTAVENVKADKADGVQKMLRDGQIYILRNGKAYDIVGREVEF